MPGAAAHGGTLSHAAVGFPTRQWDFPRGSGISYKLLGKEFNSVYQLP